MTNIDHDINTILAEHQTECDQEPQVDFWQCNKVLTSSKDIQTVQSEQNILLSLHGEDIKDKCPLCKEVQPTEPGSQSDHLLATRPFDKSKSGLSQEAARENLLNLQPYVPTGEAKKVSDAGAMVLDQAKKAEESLLSLLDQEKKAEDSKAVKLAEDMLPPHRKDIQNQHSTKLQKIVDQFIEARKKSERLLEEARENYLKSQSSKDILTLQETRENSQPPTLKANKMGEIDYLKRGEARRQAYRQLYGELLSQEAARSNLFDIHSPTKPDDTARMTLDSDIKSILSLLSNQKISKDNSKEELLIPLLGGKKQL